jgi:hypothetical protein
MDNQLQDKEIKDYVNALVDKSIEAFYLAIEIINKPTINYRSEGFCFFICNAWELALKAFLIQSKNSIEAIYLTGKDGSKRSISLSDCRRKVFTSSNHPTDANLSMIETLRNYSAHLFVKSMDINYAPAYQECVNNYHHFMKTQFPNSSLDDLSPFISLAIGDRGIPQDNLLLNPYAKDFIHAKEEGFEKNGANLLNGRLYLTKNESNADFTANVIKDPNASDVTITKVIVPTDSNKTHPYKTRTVIDNVNAFLSTNFTNLVLNSYGFNLIKKDLDLVNKKDCCYVDSHYKDKHYFYSMKAVELINDRITNDPTFRSKYCKQKR